jgi:flavin reductase (DIM6/NTAB) family NADH-FMN oxidoreductase RutF
MGETINLPSQVQELRTQFAEDMAERNGPDTFVARSREPETVEAKNDALRRKFLEGMSNAAATVSIVTTDGAAGRAGVTVSAMCSVTADAPTLLVCVHHKSRASRAIRDNGVFCVNVLRDDQALISDTFAGRLRTPSGDKFECADWEALATGAPALRHPLVAFDCLLMRHFQWGTHFIFIGEIADIVVNDSGSALIYANRGYGTLLPLEPATSSRATVHA